jgi:phosphatidylinositol alpha-mannosyltransferase
VATTLRIALVSPYGLDRFGGVRSHLLGLGEALCARGHWVEVVAPGPDGTLGTLPVVGCGAPRAVQFGGTHFDVVWASARARRRVYDRGYDLLHLHTPWNPALPLQLAAGFRGARVATFHDVAGEATPRWARALMPMASAVIRRLAVHATIAVAPEVSAYLGAGTHTVIANGITPPADWSDDHDRWPSAALPEVRPEAGPDAAPFVYVGRLEPRKDVATLLRAMALLQQRHGPHAPPPVVIAGDGPSRPALEQLRDALGLHHVHFVGAVSDAHKWALLRSARCLIAPSRSGESFGIVLLEAMAAGTVPIAADNPGYRHVLHDGGTSLLFAAGDHAALASQLARVLDAPTWYDGMRAWCAQRWPYFQWERIAERVEAVYAQALVAART